MRYHHNSFIFFAERKVWRYFFLWYNVRMEYNGQNPFEENNNQDSKRNKNLLKIVFIIFFLSIFAAAFYLLWPVFFPEKKIGPVGPFYEEIYRLVPKEVPVSSAISINLPEGVSWSDNISFSPSISGSFSEEDGLVFVPSNELDLGKDYVALIDLGDGKTLSSSFLAVANPELKTLLPQGSDIDVYTPIEIVFTGPMVDASMIGHYEGSLVSIYPETDGQFRWISDRILEFNSSSGLIPSSNYKIEVFDSVSTNGISVAGGVFSFSTSKLTVEKYPEGEISYKEPILIEFNQDIDIEKTAGGISVKSEGQEASYEVAYYEEIISNGFFGFFKKTKIYKNILAINPDESWEQAREYEVIVSKVYSDKGNVSLSEEIDFKISTTSVLRDRYIENKNVYVGEDFFDPSLRYYLEFNEPISIERSSISADYLSSINYFSDDQDIVFLEFNENEIVPGSEINVSINKIVNLEKKTILDNPITFSLNVYPEPIVDKMVVQGLDNIILCTNTPLAQPSDDQIDEYFIADKAHDKVEWNPSYLESRNGSVCDSGEYATEIEVGLSPNTDYSIKIKVEDVFSQVIPGEYYSRKITTEDSSAVQSLEISLLDKYYTVIPSNSTIVEYAAKNLSSVNVSICKISALNMLYILGGLNYSLSCIDSESFNINLPNSGFINDYFDIELKDYFEDVRGHYAITLSSGRISETNYVSVTDIFALEKRIDSTGEISLGSTLSNLYFSFNAETLNSESGIEVYPYVLEGGELVSSRSYYLQEGIKIIDQIPNLEGVIFASENDSAIIINTIAEAEDAKTSVSDFVYTDKDIYSTGEKVYIKGFMRDSYDKTLELVGTDKANLRVYNPNGEMIFNQNVDIGNFGEFYATVDISENFPLGIYNIFLEGENKDEFEVLEDLSNNLFIEISLDSEEYISGQDATILAEVKYDSGANILSGNLKYEIYAEDYYLSIKDVGYDFNSNAGIKDEVLVCEGEAEISSGRAEIVKNINLNDLFGENSSSKIFKAYLEAEDEQGNEASGAIEFIVHAGEYYLGVNTEKTVAKVGDELSANLKVVDIEGEVVGVDEIEARLYRVDWNYVQKIDESGMYFFEWEQERKEVQESILKNKNGLSYEVLSFDKEGEYEADYSLVDGLGNVIISKINFYINGENYIADNRGMEVVVQEKKFSPEEKVNVIIKSPYPKAKALVFVERGEVFQYETIDINSNYYNYSFTVRDNYSPNVFLSVFLLAPDYEYSFVEREIFFDGTSDHLLIDIDFDKEIYSPQDIVSLNILTKDYDQDPQPASLSVAVYTGGKILNNIEEFFYGEKNLKVKTLTNAPLNDYAYSFSEKNKTYNSLPEKPIETVFFEGNIETDENGKAQVSFTLPDNAGNYVVEVVGFSEDEKVSAMQTEIISRKDLGINIISPNISTFGDRFKIEAQLENSTEKEITATVLFRSDSLNLVNDEQKKQSIIILPGEKKMAEFEVLVPFYDSDKELSYIIEFDYDDKEEDYNGAVSYVLNHSFLENCYSNVSDGNLSSYLYYPQTNNSGGGINVSIGSNISVYLSELFDEILLSRSISTEALLSKIWAVDNILNYFNSDVFMDKQLYLADKLYTLESGRDVVLEMISERQNEDGGYAFSAGEQSDYYLSLFAVNILSKLNLQTTRAYNYVIFEYNNNEAYQGDTRMTILTIYSLGGIEGFLSSKSISSAISNLSSNEAFLAMASNEEIIYLSLISNSEQVSSELGKRMQEGGFGNYIEISSDADYQNFETKVKDNALLYLGGNTDVFEWLVNNNENMGIIDSFSLAEAFVDGLKNTKEIKPNFEMSLYLNDDLVDKNTFTEDNYFEFINGFVSASKISSQSVNSLNFEDVKLSESASGKYYFGVCDYYYQAEDKIAPRSYGVGISTAYLNVDGESVVSATQGDFLTKKVMIIVSEEMHPFEIIDYLPSGFTIINAEITDINFSPNSVIIEDNSVIINKSLLEPGIYEFSYQVRADTRGSFVIRPSEAIQQSYYGTSSGGIFEII